MTNRAWVCAGSVLTSVTMMGTASADVSKAWTVARAQLPASTDIVVSVDVAAFAAMPSFGRVVAALEHEEDDLRDGRALVRQACNLDLVQSIDGIVVGARHESTDLGIVFVQLKAATRAQLEACIPVAVRQAGDSATVSARGNVTIIEIDNEKLQLTWFGTDVVAITARPERADSWKVWTGHKGAFAKSPAAAQVAKADTKAAAWVAFQLAKPLDEDLRFTEGVGAVSIARDKLALAARGTLETPTQASDLRAMGKRSTTREIQSKSTPALARKILKTVGFGGTGREVTLKASGAGADLASLVPQL